MSSVGHAARSSDVAGFLSVSDATGFPSAFASGKVSARFQTRPDFGQISDAVGLQPDFGCDRISI